MTMMFEKEYEIVVAGGGIAGVAAAVEAARRGFRTALVEKTVFLGGLATAGLINFYQALCDGNGHQVTFGLAEELLHRSILYGPGEVPSGWRSENNAPEERRYTTLFSPASLVMALDEILQQAGVEVWFDTLICDVEQSESLLTGIVVENESGRGVIRAGEFIDASGSALLFRRCGAVCYDTDNFPSLWEFEFRQGRLERFVGVVSGGGEISPLLTESELTEVGLSREILAQERRGISGRLVSEMVQTTRRYLRKRYQKAYAAGTSDRHTHYPVLLPTMPQLRKIYAIHGRHTLDDSDVLHHFSDSVGLVADWRKPGIVREVPYSSLCAAAGPDNLLAAGRCIAAVEGAWEVTRVIQAAAMTGQVAGAAAALSRTNACHVCELDPVLLQEELRTLHFKFHVSEL